MSKQTRLFSFLFALVFLGAGLQPGMVRAGEPGEVQKNETGFYRDVFDQNLYYEGTNFLHLERLTRKITGKKIHAKDVNVFDEVSDSGFFVNRHGKAPLSAAELERGYFESEGTDLTGELTIIRGEFEGTQPSFFIKDSRGDEYLLEFDSIEFLELTTSAEVIGSRFYHAFGYNVPQYTIATFSPEKFTLSPDATIYDTTGFKKKLTHEKLQEYMALIPADANGRLRAVASKILKGQNRGYWGFSGRRKNDPSDLILHQDRREIRALRVFSSWVNNYDVRESNTLSMLVEENGQASLKHYLMNFNSSLGAGTEEGKPLMATHEYLFDIGEMTKAFWSLGLWEKPWQKRWREAGKVVTHSPAVGYFDNRQFNPGKFKNQLPYYAFKDMTSADGFWAAKIIHAFSDEDVRAMVKAGQYTDPKDAETVANILIERRDMIVRYWFDRVNPLEDFGLMSGTLSFKDLGVTKGYYPSEGNRYQVEVLGKGCKKLAALESQTASIDLGSWASPSEPVTISIRTIRPGATKPGPFVRVKLGTAGIAGITYQD